MDAASLKTWYLAILVVATRVQSGDTSSPLVDLQYRLIHAIDAEAAYRRAMELGVADAHDYEVDGGGRCYWDFMGLFDLLEIEADEMCDGVEVYYEMEKADPLPLVTAKEDLRVFWSEVRMRRSRNNLMEWDESV